MLAPHCQGWPVLFSQFFFSVYGGDRVIAAAVKGGTQMGGGGQASPRSGARGISGCESGRLKGGWINVCGRLVSGVGAHRATRRGTRIGF